MTDRATTALVDGLGAAAATSGVITQLQGRIFAFLYLQERPASLDDIAAALEQSKSTISVTIRGLVEWHLVRRVPTPGSRKDHYEAVTNFWRLMQEIMERRFRWTVRQVLAAVADAERALAENGGRRDQQAFTAQRLAGLSAFFTALNDGIGAFAQGQPVDPETLKTVVPLLARRPRRG
jgi:DNA-binding transcriptional regulator GbsR (MarR family)